MKFTKEQEEEMKCMKKELRAFLTNKYTRRSSIAETQRFCKTIANKYPLLKNMKWSSGFITQERSRMGLTKKKYTTIGTDKVMKKWINAQLDLWGQIKAVDVKKKYLSIAGKKMSAYAGRNLRSEMKIGVSTDGLGIWRRK